MTKPGLGHEHRKRRAAEPFSPGQRCACPGCKKCHYRGCRVLLWSREQAELDHVIARVHGGVDGPVRWLCRACNRSRGATLGNVLRGARKRGVVIPPPAPQRRAPRPWDLPTEPRTDNP